MPLMLFLKSRVGRWLAIAGGILLAVLTMRGMWKREGRRDAELDRHRETNKRVEEARDVADKTRVDVGRASDGELDEELRKAGL